MLFINNLNTKANNNYFSRYEIKYVLKKNISEEIKKQIKLFMNYDGNIDEKKSENYFVRSLYFENKFFLNFNEKVDGLKKRHKFRIRTYSKEFNDNSIFFLEQKGRYNKRTYKKRLRIDRSDLISFCSLKNLFELKKKYKDNELIEKFIFDINKKKIFPTVIVDYNRSPFINSHGLYFRLTFDGDIYASKSNSLFGQFNNKSCIPGYEILEVKFDNTIPPWFQKVIQLFQLKTVSISKFVLGIEGTGLAYDYEGR